MYGLSLYVQGFFVLQKIRISLLNLYIMTYDKGVFALPVYLLKVGGWGKNTSSVYAQIIFSVIKGVKYYVICTES